MNIFSQPASKAFIQRRARQVWLLVLIMMLAVFGIWLALPNSLAAQGGCTVTYIVRYGDHLYAIARKLNMSVWELIRLNPRVAYHPDLIFPGQQLCISYQQVRQQNQLPETDGTSNLKLALEATYTYPVQPVELDFIAPTENPATTLQVGKRVVYPAQAKDGVKAIKNRDEMPFTLTENPPPVLLLVRSEANPGKFDVVVIGEANRKLLRCLGYLQPTTGDFELPRTACDPSNPGAWDNLLTLNVPVTETCDATPLKQAFGMTDPKNDATITAALEDRYGMRQLLSISGLKVARDITQAGECYSSPGELVSALFPSTTGNANEYRIWNLVRFEGSGDTPWDQIMTSYYYPPGGGWGVYYGGIWGWR